MQANSIMHAHNGGKSFNKANLNFHTPTTMSHNFLSTFYVIIMNIADQLKLAKALSKQEEPNVC